MTQTAPIERPSCSSVASLRVTQNGEVVFVLQRQSDRRHFLGCAVGEVRNGPIFDLAPLAVGLPQEDTAIGGAIGSNTGRLGDIHTYNNKEIFPQMLGWQKKVVTTNPHPRGLLTPEDHSTCTIDCGGNIRLKRLSSGQQTPSAHFRPFHRLL